MNPRVLTPSMSLLLAFEAAARHQSYTRAAHELSLTQSAVSRQVQALETLLGVELFLRRGRRIVLTDVGRMYMGEVAVALGRLRDATLQAIAFRAGGGALHLAMLPTFGAKWLMPRLHTFYAGHPNVVVHLHAKIGAFDLEAAGMDAVIGVSQAPWPGLVSHTLLDESLVVVASPALLARHPVRAPADLASLLLLRVATRPSVWQAWFDTLAAPPAAVSYGPTFELTSHLIQAVSTGIGAGLVPRCLVEEELQAGALVAPLDTVYASGWSYAFMYPPHKADMPALAAFRAWLLAKR